MMEELQHKKINEEIEKILTFFGECTIPLEVAVCWLRERLGTIRREAIIKYSKLYKIRSYLSKLKTQTEDLQ
jgi:hypothetical protein